MEIRSVKTGGGTPLENSLLTKAKPEFVRVLRTITGVIVLSFHLKNFFPLGICTSVSASWELNRIYGGMFGKRLGRTGHFM